MEIPTDSLRKLPEGAVFSRRDGHLTLDLSLRGDTIVATARADSLCGASVSVNERMSERTQSSVEERSYAKKEQGTRAWRSCLVAFVIGCICGLLAGRKL